MRTEAFVLAVMNGRFFRDCIAGHHVKCNGMEHAGHDCHISREEQAVTAVTLDSTGQIKSDRVAFVQTYSPCCRRMIGTS